jgi:hypothetical protein
VALGPRFTVEADLVAKQELREPVAGSHQVLAHVFTGSDEVAKRLLGRPGDADRVKPSGHQQPDEVLGVAAVGLHLLGRAAWDLARCCDHALDPGFAQGPGEPIAGRAGLIGRFHRSLERARQPHHRRTLAPER